MFGKVDEPATLFGAGGASTEWLLLAITPLGATNQSLNVVEFVHVLSIDSSGWE
jgi:hypothetical protein